MIYITGDCHSKYERFNLQNFPEQKELTKDDYVIVCGDFGYVEDTKETAYWMKWMSDKPYTTLWVDGNHENFDMLKALPVEEWHGGKVHKIQPSVIHLMRGQVYDLNGIKLFSFGGARSHDMDGGILDRNDPIYRRKVSHLKKRKRYFRTIHLDWWPEEMPDEEEFEEGRRNLEKNNWQVDLAVSHCCATSLQKMFNQEEYLPDQLTDYFDTIRERLDYRFWLFGHYHENRQLTDRDYVLCEQIVALPEK